MAGRPKGGEKKGGRAKGTPNKKTAEQIKKVEDSGVTPLEYLLSVMREPIPKEADLAQIIAMTSSKMDAAKSAAPYVHAKLASIEVRAEIETFEKVISAEPLTENEWSEKYSLESSSGATESTH
ncbi:hypothetical protein KA005_19745 [bacterium]|nr:hypothetical protein [bacterium]